MSADDERHMVTRRELLVGMPLLPLVMSLASRTQDRQDIATVLVVPTNEPGTRIRITGTIYQEDGVTPAANVKIFLYHTDATGFYSRPVSDPRQSRLRATLWSDRLGQYAFSTIRPAHYADVSPPPPMHIHVHLEPPGLPDHWVDSYYFDGDAYLRPQDLQHAKSLGHFSNIVRLVERSGTLAATRDFRMSPTLAERNKLVNGWYRQ